jgi:hypothetical protein
MDVEWFENRQARVERCRLNATWQLSIALSADTHRLAILWRGSQRNIHVRSTLIVRLFTVRSSPKLLSEYEVFVRSTV